MFFGVQLFLIEPPFIPLILPYPNGNEAAFPLLGGGKLPANSKAKQAHLILKKIKDEYFRIIKNRGKCAIGH